MISFAVPAAFFGGAALAAHLVIYLLRRRRRVKIVSSVFLWRGLVPESHSGFRAETFRARLLFVLELLILITLILAAARPLLSTPQGDVPLVLVLNDSVSMQAGKEGHSFRSEGEARLLKLLKREKPGPTRVILAGKYTEILPDPASSPRDLPAILRKWTCRNPVSEMAPAVSAALDLAGENGRVLAVSDRGPASGVPDPRVRWIAAGVPLPNAGIVHAARSKGPDGDRCMLEIALFSHAPAETVLSVSGAEKKLSLIPGVRKRLVFNFPKTGAPFEALLEPDALKPDNRVLLMPEPIRYVRVEMRLKNRKTSALVRRALRASGDVEERISNGHIVFSDRREIRDGTGNRDRNSDRKDAPDDVWRVFLIRETDPKSYKGPFTADYAHPLLKGVSLDGVIWAGTSETHLPGTPLVTAGNAVLMSEQVRAAGGRRIYIRFHTERGTLHMTPAWPAMIWNLVHLRRASLPGMNRVNVRAGEPVSLHTGSHAGPFQLRLPDQTFRPLASARGRAVVEPLQCGEYAVNLGGEPYRFSANLLSPEASDLSKAETGEWGDWHKADAPGRGAFPLARLLLCFALAGFCVHHRLAAEKGRGLLFSERRAG